MKEGDIALVELIQSDGSSKLRPVLLLKILPKYNDYLVCGISTPGWVKFATSPGLF